MNTTFLLVGLLSLGVLALGMAYPLLLARREKINVNLANSSLEDQLQRYVSAVRDLDFDYDTGKLAQEDYITQRKLLVGRGVSTLIQLDDLRQTDPLEKEIAAFRRHLSA
jgi:hypothetical protein